MAFVAKVEVSDAVVRALLASGRIASEPSEAETRVKRTEIEQALSNALRDWAEITLKSIDPLLNADVLYALRAMGHGLAANTTEKFSLTL